MLMGTLGVLVGVLAVLGGLDGVGLALVVLADSATLDPGYRAAVGTQQPVAGSAGDTIAEVAAKKQRLDRTGRGCMAQAETANAAIW
jgi:hypothetical protein